MTFEEFVKSLADKESRQKNGNIMQSASPAMMTNMLEEWNVKPTLKVGDFVKQREQFTRYKADVGIVTKILSEPSIPITADGECSRECLENDIQMGIISGHGEFIEFKVDSRCFEKLEVDKHDVRSFEEILKK